VDEGIVKYDYLVVGVGAENATFGIPGVKEHACFLKEIWDAKKIRRKLMDCIESAHFPGQTIEEVDRLLHMVVVGGGPTGVEYAAELRDFLVEDLVKWYPEIAQRLKITLVEAMPHVLPMFNAKLVEYTEKHFNDENISLRLNTMVKEVTENVVRVQEKKKIFVEKEVDGKMQLVEEEELQKFDIPYGLLVWATGNGVRPVVKDLMAKLPQDLQDSRRGLVIDEHLRVKGAAAMFAIGDCSSSKWTATAQVANQQGIYLGKLLNRKGKRIAKLTERGDPIPQAMDKVDQGDGDLSFDYVHRGALAYIGTDKAIADLPGGVHLAGIATFLFWRSVYLSTLFSMRNKLMLMFDWSKTLIFGRDISRE
jgi:NADH:ubiquinone reductase (non-electrogenic)